MSGYRGLAHGYRYDFRLFGHEMPKSVAVHMSSCRGLAHGYRYDFRRFEAEMPKSVAVTMSICRDKEFLQIKFLIPKETSLDFFACPRGCLWA